MKHFQLEAAVYLSLKLLPVCTAGSIRSNLQRRLAPPLLLLLQTPTRTCPCTCTHYLMDVLSSAWPWVQPMIRQPLVSSEPVGISAWASPRPLSVLVQRRIPADMIDPLPSLRCWSCGLWFLRFRCRWWSFRLWFCLLRPFRCSWGLCRRGFSATGNLLRALAFA